MMVRLNATLENQVVSGLRRVIALVAACLASVPMAAQSNGPPIEHAETDLVLVPAVVTDKNYHPLFDLQRDQFELRVDHAPTPLSGFWTETGPVSVVLVIDASKSMKSVLARSKEALQGFLSLANPEDEYALVLCRKRGAVTLPFTSDLREIRESVLSITPEGSTPLFDSIDLALDLVREAKNKRRAILVISDGQDTSSKTRFDKLRARVLESTAYLYALEFWTGQSYDTLETQPLRELASLTGGLFFDDVSPKRFAEYFADVDLHRQYVLAFHPAAAPHDSKQHQLEVRLRDVNTSKPKVFWRHTYTDSSETFP